MTQERLGHYVHRFSHLKRNHHASFGSAPHKPALLLTLLQAIDIGLVKENFVPITADLAAIFSATWEALVEPATWQERMSYPFRYLITDGFWELVKDGSVVSGGEVGAPSNLFQLAQRIDGGRFTADLWDLLQDATTRSVLRQQLMSTYFDGVEVPQSSTDALLNSQAQRLLSEASAKFRPKPTVADDAGMFVRHTLFPTVVAGLYSYSCAVCSQDSRIADNHIVDAAHILPFAKYRNDDPRNGIALCKNHHWAFDAGGIGVSDNFTIITNRKMLGKMPIVEVGARLILPSQAIYAPAVEALRWHRENVMMR